LWPQSGLFLILDQVMSVLFEVLPGEQNHASVKRGRQRKPFVNHVLEVQALGQRCFAKLG
jgi:hypothetical protein